MRVEWMGWLSWDRTRIIVLFGKGWMDVGKGMRGHFVTMSNSNVIFVYINWFVIRLFVR